MSIKGRLMGAAKRAISPKGKQGGKGLVGRLRGMRARGGVRDGMRRLTRSARRQAMRFARMGVKRAAQMCIANPMCWGPVLIGSLILGALSLAMLTFAALFIRSDLNETTAEQIPEIPSYSGVEPSPTDDAIELARSQPGARILSSRRWTLPAKLLDASGSDWTIMRTSRLVETAEETSARSERILGAWADALAVWETQHADWVAAYAAWEASKAELKKHLDDDGECGPQPNPDGGVVVPEVCLGVGAGTAPAKPAKPAPEPDKPLAAHDGHPAVGLCEDAIEASVLSGETAEPEACLRPAAAALLWAQRAAMLDEEEPEDEEEPKEEEAGDGNDETAASGFAAAGRIFAVSPLPAQDADTGLADDEDFLEIDGATVRLPDHRPLADSTTLTLPFLVAISEAPAVYGTIDDDGTLKVCAHQHLTADSAEDAADRPVAAGDATLDTEKWVIVRVVGGCQWPETPDRSWIDEPHFSSGTAVRNALPGWAKGLGRTPELLAIAGAALDSGADELNDVKRKRIAAAMAGEDGAYRSFETLLAETFGADESTLSGGGWIGRRDSEDDLLRCHWLGWMAQNRSCEGEEEQAEAVLRALWQVPASQSLVGYDPTVGLTPADCPDPGRRPFPDMDQDDPSQLLPIPNEWYSEWYSNPAWAEKNPVYVAPCVYSLLEALITASQTDPTWPHVLPLTVVSGYRSYTRQEGLRIGNCGGNTPYNVYEKPSRDCKPPTAIPGRSMHHTGQAIDFCISCAGHSKWSPVNPIFLWLEARLPQHGMDWLVAANERWHWSPTGQ